MVSRTALGMSGVLDRSPQDLIAEAVDTLKTRHLDRPTGLLNSRIRFEGEVMEGPEGSSIFFVAHMLQFLDPEFARDQYRRARQHLGSDQWGFAWAREWPLRTFEPDVDSGVSIPILDISAGASGMATLGASAFSDAAFRTGLLTTLYFGAFPLYHDGPRDSVRFAASNRIGDAVCSTVCRLNHLWMEH